MLELGRDTRIPDRHPIEGRWLIERAAGPVASGIDETVPRLILLTRFDQKIRRVFGGR